MTQKLSHDSNFLTPCSSTSLCFCGLQCFRMEVTNQPRWVWCFPASWYALWLDPQSFQSSYKVGLDLNWHKCQFDRSVTLCILASQPANMLRISIVLFGLSTCITSVTTASWANDVMRVVSFGSFLILEISIGIYFPAIGCLRGIFIPEDRRASVTNWFRVPMNIITCITLLSVNHPAIGSDKRAIFTTCTGLLITCGIISTKFIALTTTKETKKE